MTTLATRTIQKTNSLEFLRRIAHKDQRAVKTNTDPYDNFVWALAKEFTSSNEEAEAAAQEIFTDIWKYAEPADKPRSAEKLLVSLIARRRLIKCLQ